jgi:4'-phosphopantetheinyl transferase
VVFEIARQTTHLWLCSVDESRDIPATRQMYLSSDERERIRTFVFDRDRRRYTTTRLMVRDILSECIARPCGDVRFATDAHGRPQLLDQPPHPDGPITFNISHTVGLTTVAVRRGTRIGIDVEARDRVLEVARMSQFLSAVDLQVLAAVPADLQRLRLIDIWTLKESYAKARGLGLRLSLNRFGIDFPNQGAVSISFDNGIDDTSLAWHLWQFHIMDGAYSLAVCIERDPASVSPLVVQEVDLLGTRRNIDIVPVRQSLT